MTNKLKPGDEVRLKRCYQMRPGKRETALIVHSIDDVEGGVVVSRPLEGFTNWNVEHLEPIAKCEGAR